MNGREIRWPEWAKNHWYDWLFLVFCGALVATVLTQKNLPPFAPVCFGASLGGYAMIMLQNAIWRSYLTSCKRILEADER